MAESKFCVIIDDDNLGTLMTNIQYEAKREIGVDLQFVQFNPRQKGLIIENRIDRNLLFDALYTSDYLERKIDFLICDYNLKDANTNGYDVIMTLREKGFKKPIILLSSNIEHVILTIIGNNGLTNHAKVRKVKRLLNSNISDFCDKDGDIKTTLLTFLSRNDFNLESAIQELLEKYKEWKFRSTYPHFKDKSISEILHEIRNSSPHGIKFQKSLLSSAIAHLILLNEEINNEKQ